MEKVLMYEKVLCSDLGNPGQIDSFSAVWQSSGSVDGSQMEVWVKNEGDNDM